MYNAYVLPVLTYNAATWGLTKQKEEKLSAFHRRQLRRLLGIRWPERISNEALYRRTKVEPLETHVKRSRLRMLGYVLRLHRLTPAQKSMDLYFSDGNRPRGGPAITLPSKLKKDLADAELKFSAQGDLDKLRSVAADRKRWQEVIERCGAGPRRV